MNDIITDFLQQILQFLVNIANLIVSVLLNLVFSIFDLAVEIVNYVVEFIFSSAGFLSAISKLIPTHIYTFITICISAIIVRAIIKKVIA